MKLKEAVYVYRLVSGDRLAWHGRYHAHEPGDYEFHVFLEGQGIFLLNKTRYRIEGNRLFLTMPREFHSILPEAVEKPISYYAFLFEPEIEKNPDREIIALLQQNSSKRTRGITIENRERFLIEELYFLMGSKFISKQQAAEYLLLSLIHRWYTPADTTTDYSVLSSSKNDYVERTLQIMQESVQKKLTTRTIASRLGLSEEHFIRLFRKNIGMSPLQYFTRVKIEAASSYLIETTTSIETIAERFSFENPFHFSRVFKRCTGLSPREYRQIYRQDISSIIEKT